MTQCDAIVVAVTADQVWVEVPQRVSACGSCKSADGCQAGVPGLMAGPRRYRLDAACEAQVGDYVSLRVAEGALWQASWASYLLPALLAIGGAAIGQSFAGDILAVAGTLAGLGFGFALLRLNELRARRAQGLFSLQPKIKEVRFIKEKS
jgi:positive regulator of sigma E activity